MASPLRQSTLFLFSSIFTIIIVTTSAELLDDNLCGCEGWAAYKDEKCYKVINQVVTQTQAATICKQYDEEAVLAIIKTKEEQDFLESYLKKEKVIDYVWIGLKRNGIDKTFVWPDNTGIEYSKWAPKRPMTSASKSVSPKSNDYDCVQINTDKQGFGQWLDVMCGKKNVFVCQKMQNWTLSRLQSILIDARRNYLGTIDKHNKEIALIKQALPVPIGFIYVQFSGQAQPNEIWPGTEWSQVTESYAGLFFRAEGGGSAGFDEVQDQLTKSYVIESNLIGNAADNPPFTNGPLTIGPEYDPNFLLTGDNTGQAYYGIKIRHNNEETRPRNQAIRIWKRTA